MTKVREPLQTERLLLRSPNSSDAFWIAEEIARPEVHSWLTRVPRPFHISDAKTWIAATQSRDWHFVIEFAGVPTGVVSIDDELGYWLRPSAWRKGIMIEAVSALVERYFDVGGEVLVSSYLNGNLASASLQEKLGFEVVGSDLRESNYWGFAVEVKCTRLSRAAWQSASKARDFGPS